MGFISAERVFKAMIIDEVAHRISINGGAERITDLALRLSKQKNVLKFVIWTYFCENKTFFEHG